jgi:hypothetical protein
MHVNEAQRRLEEAGLIIEKRERTSNDKAWQSGAKLEKVAA